MTLVMLLVSGVTIADITWFDDTGITMLICCGTVWQGFSCPIYTWNVQTNIRYDYFEKWCNNFQTSCVPTFVTCRANSDLYSNRPMSRYLRWWSKYSRRGKSVLIKRIKRKKHNSMKSISYKNWYWAWSPHDTAMIRMIMMTISRINFSYVDAIFPGTTGVSVDDVCSFPSSGAWVWVCSSVRDKGWSDV